MTAVHAPAIDHTSCLDDLVAASYAAPAGVTELSACAISWGGYQPGRIPTSAMRYSPHFVAIGCADEIIGIAAEELHAAR